MSSPSSTGQSSHAADASPTTTLGDAAGAIAFAIAAELGHLEVRQVLGEPTTYTIGGHMLVDVESVATATELGIAEPETQIACNHYVFSPDPDAALKTRARARRAFLLAAQCR